MSLKYEPAPDAQGAQELEQVVHARQFGFPLGFLPSYPHYPQATCTQTTANRASVHTNLCHDVQPALVLACKSRTPLCQPLGLPTAVPTHAERTTASVRMKSCPPPPDPAPPLTRTSSTEKVIQTKRDAAACHTVKQARMI